MSTFSLRLTADEKRILQDYAKAHGISMAAAIKGAFFDMLEDQCDAKIADEAYQSYLHDPQTVSFEEVRKKYGI